MARWWLILLAVALAGCQSCPPISERTVCPEIRKYTKEQQIAMADELGKLGADISEYLAILADRSKLMKILRDELLLMKK